MAYTASHPYAHPISLLHIVYTSKEMHVILFIFNYRKKMLAKPLLG